MKTTLQLAAVYNILWGTWVVLFPHHFFDLIGMERMIHPMIWQALGMVVGAYGLAYWWSSYNPMKHWPVIAVGFIGKVLGPIGFVQNYLEGKIPFDFIYTNIFNDIIWWIPFGYILYKVHKDHHWKLH